MKLWRIVDHWRGGKGPLGSKDLPALVVFTSNAAGNAGHNECFVWVHRHTPFSFAAATKDQGYTVEEAPKERAS